MESYASHGKSDGVLWESTTLSHEKSHGKPDTFHQPFHGTAHFHGVSSEFPCYYNTRHGKSSRKPRGIPGEVHCTPWEVPWDPIGSTMYSMGNPMGSTLHPMGSTMASAMNPIVCFHGISIKKLHKPRPVQHTYRRKQKTANTTMSTVLSSFEPV